MGFFDLDKSLGFYFMVLFLVFLAYTSEAIFVNKSRKWVWKNGFFPYTGKVRKIGNWLIGNPGIRGMGISMETGNGTVAVPFDCVAKHGKNTVSLTEAEQYEKLENIPNKTLQKLLASYSPPFWIANEKRFELKKADPRKLLNMDKEIDEQNKTLENEIYQRQKIIQRMTSGAKRTGEIAERRTIDQAMKQFREEERDRY